jgi:hypothetical protein
VEMVYIVRCKQPLCRDYLQYGIGSPVHYELRTLMAFRIAQRAPVAFAEKCALFDYLNFEVHSSAGYLTTLYRALH